MTTSTIAHPPIVSRDQWLVARKELLTKEKERTRHRDAVNADRRGLPMVRIDTDNVKSRAGVQPVESARKPSS